MIKKIVMSGGWGYGNIGDEAILKYTYQDLQKTFPSADIVVLSYNVEQTMYHHSIDSYNNLHFLLRLNAGKGLIEECKKMLSDNIGVPEYLQDYLHYFDGDTLFVMAGGGYFNDHWLESFYVHLVEIKIANICGAKIAIIGQTFGPISGDKHLSLLAKYIKMADFVDVRDKTSYDFLCEIVSENSIHLSCDAVVRNASEQKKVGNEKVIGVMFQRKRPYTNPKTSKLWYRIEQAIHIISGRSAAFTNNLCETINIIQKQHPEYSVVFLQSTDWREKEIDKLKQRSGAKKIYVNCRVDEYISIINRCSAVITTNMHPAILATTVGIPAIAISHTYKMNDYMKAIGMEAYSFSNMDSQKISHAIDQVLESEHIQNEILQKEQKLVVLLDEMYENLKNVIEED